MSGTRTPNSPASVAWTFILQRLCGSRGPHRPTAIPVCLWGWVLDSWTSACLRWHWVVHASRMLLLRNIRPSPQCFCLAKSLGERTFSVSFLVCFLQNKRTWTISSIKLFGNTLSHQRSVGREVSLQSNRHMLWIQTAKQKFELRFKRRCRGSMRGVSFHSRVDKTLGGIALPCNTALALYFITHGPGTACFLFHLPLTYASLWIPW